MLPQTQPPGPATPGETGREAVRRSAIARQRTTTETDLYRRRAELETLSEFSAAVSRGDDLEILLQRAGDLVSELTGYPYLLIALYRSAVGTMRPVHAVGIPAHLLSTIEEFDIGEGTIGEAAATRRIVVSHKPRGKLFGGIWAELNVEEAIGVPLVDGGELLGAFTVGKTVDQGSDHPPSDGFLTNLATILGGAIQRTRHAKHLLRYARRLESRQQDLAVLVEAVSHHVKAPLISIAGLLGVVRARIDPADKGMHAAMEQIDRSMARLSAILQDVVEHSELSRPVGHRQAVASEDVIAAATAHLQPRIAAEGAVIDVGEHLPVLRGDRARIERLLVELIANAVEHGRPAEGEHRVRVRFEKTPSGLRLLVKDNGPGMPARDTEHAFQPFWRGRGAGRVAGTGVGLAVARRIAQAHGWHIGFGRGKKGATLVVDIPAEAEDHARHSLTPLGATPPRQGLKS